MTINDHDEAMNAEFTGWRVLCIGLRQNLWFKNPDGTIWESASEDLAVAKAALLNARSVNPPYGRNGSVTYSARKANQS